MWPMDEWSDVPTEESHSFWPGDLVWDERKGMLQVSPLVYVHLTGSIYGWRHGTIKSRWPQEAYNAR